MIRPVLVALASVVILTAVWAFSLPSGLSLESLKIRQAWLTELVADRPLVTALGYVGIYTFIAALSLPGAAILTLAGGSLFGLWQGTIMVSIASTLGATLAFLSARFLLRETIIQRFTQRLQVIDAGIERDGIAYLLTLRLIPVLPFFVINLAMGLTTMRPLVFALVSQIGMLPATLVYVNAGTRLAEIEKAGDILAWPIALSFVALGLLPWIGKAIAGFVQRRRLYARFRKPLRFDRNLIVIGGGATGLVTAYVAAAIKAKVTLVEAHKMGGDCLNYGCVPSKALIMAARIAHQSRKSADYGIDTTLVGIRFKDVMLRVQRVITEIAPHDSIERYVGLGVDVVEGRAHIVDPWTVEVKHQDGSTSRLTTRSIVVATGAAPHIPQLPGLEEVGYLTSDTLWADLAMRDTMPERIAILGGGAIGCELGQSLARLGARVTLVEHADRLLSREDPDVSDIAEKSLCADGVTVLAAHRALKCDVRAGEKLLLTEIGGLRREIAFDILIVAVGRRARLAGYGLEDLGIPVGRVIETNAYLETLYPNIFAAGDVAGPYQLTHAAGHQGWHAAVNALMGRFKRFAVNYATVPTTTFLDPEIARVGLNETEAKAKGIAYEVTRYDTADLDRAIIEGNARGFVKILTVPGKDRILGATIIGGQAGEILAEFTLAMRHGLGLNAILSTIHAYPTMAEANKYAAGVWKKANAPGFVLRLLARYHAWERG
ncbi:Lpd Pyruvate/2-oxoglutarate dehydrogenase complex, dihydrolipoamide dehydrogenase (E3) component, and related enzymes [Rhabdaerophilaceae bacterium]